MESPRPQLNQQQQNLLQLLQYRLIKFQKSSLFSLPLLMFSGYTVWPGRVAYKSTKKNKGITKTIQNTKHVM